jgi:predicted kinase
MRATILQAIPGAGKSTFAKKFRGAVIVSADDYFTTNGVFTFDGRKLNEAHAYSLRKFVVYLEQKKELVIVDNTNISLAEYAPYAALARAYDYEVGIVTILEDPVKAFKRNIHGVGLKRILIMDTELRAGLTRVPSYWPHTVMLAEDLQRSPPQ